MKSLENRREHLCYRSRYKPEQSEQSPMTVCHYNIMYILFLRDIKRIICHLKLKYIKNKYNFMKKKKNGLENESNHYHIINYYRYYLST